jgi:pimeloyl-ACP methyl ester carboxylesterase
LIRPTQTDRLAARIPNAEVLRFDDAGHGVTFQKAPELNAALREHVGRHEPVATPPNFDAAARMPR